MNIDQKKVSVIMGIYNCENTLIEAIESIINQTYENWELILCDDCSTDGTFSIADNYKQNYPQKIFLIRNEKNITLAASLNRCLQYSKGDYIARMDGDDISIAKRFETQVDFLNSHPEYDLVGTQMISFDESGDVGVRKIKEIPTCYDLRFGSVFAHATIMARKNVYTVLNGYTVTKETRRCEDIDLWFRFFENGFCGYNLQVPLYKVRETKSDFKRRKFRYGIDAFKLHIVGYRKLKFPIFYYIYAIKPIIAYMIPPVIMKKYHNYIERKR